MKKQILRDKYKIVGNCIAEKDAKSRIICEKIRKTAIFSSIKSIAVFYSDGIEPDLRLLVEFCLNNGIAVCYPKTFGKDMAFYKIDNSTHFIPGPLGIMEPDSVIKVEQIDLMIVPGIAFDYRCSRLGHGAGYYDRYLFAHPGQKTIGVIYDELLLEDDLIEISFIDEPVDFVITDKSFYCNEKTCKEKTTLCYLENDDKYLLLHRNKKQNDLNVGKYIGVGGHLENNETPDEAMKREVIEETGLTVLSFQKRGTIYFSDDSYCEIMYLYTSNEFIGSLKECDEGELLWVNKNDILSLPHWEGDEAFLKLLSEDSPYFELSLQYSGGKLIKAKRLL